MPRVVVIGGGLAGCAAAAMAAKAGAQVVLLERMEVLGGCALFAGRVDHRYFTVREELRLMEGDDIFQVFDRCALHSAVRFPWPGPEGAIKDLYDTTRLDGELRKQLAGLGVEVRVISRAKDVVMEGVRLREVVLDDGTGVAGDTFVDATGGAGGRSACHKYGHGCVMCFIRCPAFGDRVSIAAKAGITELRGQKKDGSPGPITAAIHLVKETLAPDLKRELEATGIVIVPIPAELIDYGRTASITASANIDGGFAENVVLADVGHYAKRIAAGYTPLSELQRIPGLERAIIADPAAGTLGNAVRYMALTPRGDALDVPGTDNLFVASEKLGINGVGEATVTGVIAGNNAARRAAGTGPLVLPHTTMTGSFIAYVNGRWDTEDGLRQRSYIFSGPFWSAAQRTGLATEDRDLIRARIHEHGLEGVFGRKLS